MRIPFHTKSVRFAATLATLAVVLAGAACSGGGDSPPERLVLIGLDGADPGVIDVLRTRGELPNFDRLFEEGISTVTDVDEPVFSPVIWTTLFTGCRPEKHGVTSFTLPSADSTRRVPVTSNLRRRRTLWDILGSSGIDVGVVGHWVTWPAEKVNGFLLTNYTWPPSAPFEKEWTPGAEWDTVGRRTYPDRLDEVVRPAVNAGRYFASEHFPEIDRLDPALRHYLDKDFAYLNAGMALYDARSPHFFTQYMESIDFFEHRLWMIHRLYENRYHDAPLGDLPPLDKPLPPGVLERIGPMVAQTYRLADRLIGLFLDRLDLEKDAIVVVSDHGFRDWPPGTRLHVGDGKYEEMPFWHSRHGILLAAGGPFRKGKADGAVAPEQLTPLILAAFGLPVGKDMDGAVRRDLFRKEFLEAHPVKRIDSYESGGKGSPAPAPVESPMDDQMREMLKSLGYLD